MSHYRRNGALVGWGPTVQEIDHLAKLFAEIRHIGCLHSEAAPASALPYSARNIHFIPVRPLGGKSLGKKLAILAEAPSYLMTMRQHLGWADVVHVRCPANVPLLAILLLAIVRQPSYRWVKYAGNWQPDGQEAWSYTLQRWWLNRGLHRGIVTINGRWPGQPDWVYSFLNPCLTLTDIEEANKITAGKKIDSPLQMLFVGRVEAAKGVGRILEIALALKNQGIFFQLHIVGDGPQQPTFADWVQDHGLAPNVVFHGWLPRTALPQLYARAHFFLFPSASEGWPKVLSEAMAYGAVPLAGAVSSIPQILPETGAGQAFNPFDTRAFVQAIISYLNRKDEWQKASLAGRQAASLFTYEAYLTKVQETCRHAWGLSLSCRANIIASVIH